MKVLVPGKYTDKTAIGSCGKCEAILQEMVSALCKDPNGYPGVSTLGEVPCPNCGSTVKMYALDSDSGRGLLSKVAAYQNKLTLRSATGINLS